MYELIVRLTGTLKRFGITVSGEKIYIAPNFKQAQEGQTGHARKSKV